MNQLENAMWKKTHAKLPDMIPVYLQSNYADATETSVGKQKR